MFRLMKKTPILLMLFLFSFFVLNQKEAQSGWLRCVEIGSSSVSDYFVQPEKSISVFEFANPPENQWENAPDIPLLQILAGSTTAEFYQSYQPSAPDPDLPAALNLLTTFTAPSDVMLTRAIHSRTLGSVIVYSKTGTDVFEYWVEYGAYNRVNRTRVSGTLSQVSGYFYLLDNGELYYLLEGLLVHSSVSVISFPFFAVGQTLYIFDANGLPDTIDDQVASVYTFSSPIVGLSTRYLDDEAGGSSKVFVLLENGDLYFLTVYLNDDNSVSVYGADSVFATGISKIYDTGEFILIAQKTDGSFLYVDAPYTSGAYEIELERTQTLNNFVNSLSAEERNQLISTLRVPMMGDSFCYVSTIDPNNLPQPKAIGPQFKSVYSVVFPSSIKIRLDYNDEKYLDTVKLFVTKVNVLGIDYDPNNWIDESKQYTYYGPNNGYRESSEPIRYPNYEYYPYLQYFTFSSNTIARIGSVVCNNDEQYCDVEIEFANQLFADVDALLMISYTNKSNLTNEIYEPESAVTDTFTVPIYIRTINTDEINQLKDQYGTDGSLDLAKSDAAAPLICQTEKLSIEEYVDRYFYEIREQLLAKYQEISQAESTANEDGTTTSFIVIRREGSCE